MGSHDLLVRVAGERKLTSERQSQLYTRRHLLFNFVAEADG